ncbi:MAG: amidohydrolase family protein [Armatimonadota bacterium]|nr:amidohydrolase family protein [Armatimonadota bacterium]
MLIDVNCYIGHWAFRPFPWYTAADLLRAMDAHGIDQAFVSSASAILYRDSQAGNEELYAAVRAHTDRLIPFAVINPTYSDWRHDLAVCHEEFGARGVRLYPKYHRYTLTDSNGDALIRAATERGMVISIPGRVEDYRQRSWLLDVADVSAAEMAEVAKRHPRARFLPVNGIGFTNTAFGAAGALECDYAIEISRLSAFVSEEIQTLISRVGPERLAFGSGMPFTVPEVPLLKLEVLDVSEEVKEAIRWKNAARLIGAC